MVIATGLFLWHGDSLAVTDKIFGSWSLVCTKHCTISQVTSRDPEGRKVIMGVSVYFQPGKTKANMDIRISPEVVEQAGIGIKVDDYPSFKLSMSKCDVRVCLASGFLDEPLLTQLKSGKLATIALVRKNSKLMHIPLSLSGFQPAFSELQREHIRKPK